MIAELRRLFAYQEPTVGTKPSEAVVKNERNITIVSLALRAVSFFGALYSLWKVQKMGRLLSLGIVFLSHELFRLGLNQSLRIENREGLRKNFLDHATEKVTEPASYFLREDTEKTAFLGLLLNGIWPEEEE